MAVTGFRIVVTAGMGRFLRVIPQPNLGTTVPEQAKILRALKTVWPQSQAVWTVDERGLLASRGKALSGEPSQKCCQMLYVGVNGQGEPITDQQAKNLIAAELRKEFPEIQI